MLADLIAFEIDAQNIDVAESLLATLDRRFGNARADIRRGLRCKLFIAQKRYSDALALVGQMRNKTNFYYKKIRRDALAGELRASSLDDRIRSEYEFEVEILDKELESVDYENIYPTDRDPVR